MFIWLNYVTKSHITEISTVEHIVLQLNHFIQLVLKESASVSDPLRILPENS